MTRKLQHVPWSDVAELVQLAGAQDAEGYTAPAETTVPVMCSWTDGVSQSEFYYSHKAGMAASAQVTVWKADLDEVWPAGTAGDRFVEFSGRRYRVIRTAPVDLDTVCLILQEVVR